VCLLELLKMVPAATTLLLRELLELLSPALSLLLRLLDGLDNLLPVLFHSTLSTSGSVLDTFMDSLGSTLSTLPDFLCPGPVLIRSRLGSFGSAFGGTLNTLLHLLCSVRDSFEVCLDAWTPAVPACLRCCEVGCWGSPPLSSFDSAFVTDVCSAFVTFENALNMLLHLLNMLLHLLCSVRASFDVCLWTPAVPACLRCCEVGCWGSLLRSVLGIFLICFPVLFAYISRTMPEVVA